MLTVRLMDRPSLPCGAYPRGKTLGLVDPTLARKSLSPAGTGLELGRLIS